jgi:6-phosphogluconolactonase/glucosamine-6-phosphate isomerase/deaminase
MQFVKEDVATGERQLSELLTQSLTVGKRVLWLVPGGSNIPVAVAVMTALPDNVTKNLTIMLGDERYGPVGHADSNAERLHAAGFDFKHATFIPILTGDDLKVTAEKYEDAAQKHFTASDLLVGQFGVGDDGHIAGIRPHSPGATAVGELTVGYEWTDYARVTLTFPAIRQLHVAYAFVYGEDKRHTLEQLRNETLPLADQPAQILKAVHEAYVYNDQLS